MSSEAGDAVTEKDAQRRGKMPKLRFPEFAACPYTDVRLGHVTEEPRPRNKGLVSRAFVMGVRKDDGIVPMEERLIAKDIGRYKIVSTDSFAYNPMRLNIGSIARWRGAEDVLVSPDYVVFRCLANSKATGLLPDYLDQFRRSTQWDAFVNESGDGGVRKRVYYDDIAKLPIRLPALGEQQKIADCLSSLDAVIAAEGERLAALKAHKKGLIQTLFPAPGQTTPRLRFPESQGAGEWEATTLGEICDVAQGFGFPEAMQGKELGDYPFCKVSDISRAVAESGAVLSSAVNYVDQSDLKALRARTIPPGATVFAKIGEALRLNRRAIAAVECLIDNNAVALIPKAARTVDYFLFLLSQQIDMNEHCGGAVPSVNKSTLEAIPIFTPKVKSNKQSRTAS